MALGSPRIIRLDLITAIGADLDDQLEMAYQKNSSDSEYEEESEGER